MCLAKIYDGKPRQRVGYKILQRSVHDDTFFTGGCSFDAGRIYLRKGQYCKDPEAGGFIHTLLQSYPTGFHIFAKLSDAKKVREEMYAIGLVICKVAFKEVVAWGSVCFFSHCGADTIVASQVKIIEEVV